jgi:DNA-damage-inducible protein J
MAQSNVNIRMDEDVKKAFDQVCCDLGINMSIAITILAKKMIREQRIPFEVSVDPFYSKANEDRLRNSIKQLEQGKVVSKTLEELEGLANG